MKKILSSGRNYILVAIIALAAVLRLWNLGTIPAGLTQDEAALGYNAYSILETGRDEYGEKFPIIFKSFGDFKPGLYVYLDVPFVATLGVNEVSTRLPSAIMGIVSVLLIFLISRLLFTNNKSLALVAAFVAATNPWLIYFSRAAWEANVSLGFTLFGILFFLKALKQSKHLLTSAFFFGLTLVTYQGAKLSTGLVVLVLGVIYFKEIFKFDKKYLFGGILLGTLISVPIILSLFSGQTGRLKVFSIFSYPRPIAYIQSMLDQGGEKIGDFSYYLFHSETLNFKRGILGRYFNHFSAKFLIFEGDYQNLKDSAPYHGMFLLGDILLLAAGAFAITKGFSSSLKSNLFIILWLGIASLPAVLTRDQVQSVRALDMAIPLIFVVAIGLSYTLQWIESRKFKLPFYLILVSIYSVGLVYFADAYYIHVPAHNSNYWNYGYKEVVETVRPLQSGYDTVFIEQSYMQPYIYFLYYGLYDPAIYQKHATLTSGQNAYDVGKVEKLDNISFRNIDWEFLQRKHGALVVVNGITWIPEYVQYEVIKEIKYLNGRDPAFRIIEMK